METFTNTYRTNNEREFYVETGMLGATTSPQSANQIQEATSRLNAGVKHIELELISPELFDSIPKQHFKEMKRMADLTDASINIHAPAQMDLAGFGTGKGDEQWSESQRKSVEENMKHMMDRGMDLGENTIVNFHSSGGVKAFEWQAEGVKMGDEKEHPPDDKRKMFVIDQIDSRHQVTPLEYEEKEYFGHPQTWTPEDRRVMMNKSSWDGEKLQLFNYEKEKAEINDRLRDVDAQIGPLKMGAGKGVLTKDEERQLGGLLDQKRVMDGHISEINVHMDTQLQDLHDKFSRYAPKEEVTAFNKKNGKGYEQLIKMAKKENEFKKDWNNFSEIYKDDEKKVNKLVGKYGEKFVNSQIGKDREKHKQEMRQSYLNAVQAMPTPEKFVSTDSFAKKNMSETVSNAALDAYKKWGEKAPVIAIENVYPDWTLGRADSLRKAIEESREKFAKKLVKKNSLSKSKAKEVSEKLIGATWDIGHITQLRKYGYSDKQIAEEAKKIAPVVKHIHVTDNFGFQDSHIAPGQGTVPIKKQLDKLREGLGKEYSKVAHILESGGFAGQFKTSPRMQELEHFNSPLYEHVAGPNWKEIAYTHAEYSMGYGIMFPEKHFEMYGTGFSNLPQELGGQVQGDKSRFAGTPNQ